jgi:uncharacterized pyridoxamine 5'-phosphate oxidase family protein
MENNLLTAAQTIPLDYTGNAIKVFEDLKQKRLMVFASCAEQKVTARMMSVIHHNQKIYFQTGANSVKFEQLSNNPNAALCIDNVQIEGTARDLGHVLNPENSFFAETYSQIHPGSFKLYSHLSFNRLIEITPHFITLWKYDADGKPFQDFIDLDNKNAWRQYYPTEG